MHQDATRYGGRPQPRRLCVRWGPNPLPQKGRSPTQFSAHVYCGQTAAWIKMPLSTEVGLGLRDIVFDVQTQLPTLFLAHVCYGQVAGWMKAPLGTEVDLGPNHIVLYGVPVPAKGGQQSPSFRPVSTVATVAHLSYC